MQLRDRPTALEPVPDADPEGYDRDPSKTVYLQLVPSTADALTVPDSALWLAALRTAREPIAFEIVGSAAGIRLYFVAQQRDAPLLRSALARATSYAYLDEVRPNPLNAYWDAVLKSDLKSRLSFDFRDAYLDGPDHLTLADPPRRDHSPLEPLLETLATLPPYACGFYQALFAPAERDWARDFRAYLGSRTTSFETLSVPDAYGWPQQRVLTRREHPELSDAELAAHEHRAKPKHDPTTPLFALCARFGVIGLREHFPARFGALKAVLAAYSAPPRRFQVLTRADYRAQGFETEDLRYLFRNRISYRSGQIVSAAELAALVHIPPPATLELFRGDLGPGVARLGRLEQVGRTAAAPATPADGQLLGVNTHRGVAQEVRLSADPPYMNRHCYVFGGSGRGKSTALRALIAAHLEAGDGFGLIDPHGKLAREARAMVAAAGQAARLRYLHPVRSPIPFNVLAHDGTDAARAQIKADLLDFFAQVSGTAPGVNIAMVLDAALDVLLNRADSTLDDLYAIVSDGPAREEMLERLGTADDRRRWANEILPVLKRGGAQIVTNKLAILRTPLLRPICSSRANAIDFRAILDGRLILLVDFGGIDSKTAAALGRLLTGKLAVSAMTRAHPVPPWYGYIDEFQTMTTPSMVAILQGARKAGLHLTLANQRYFDLPADIAGALSNCYTTLCLGTDDDRDLGLFAKRFEGSFTRQDLRALGRGSGLMLVGARAFNIEVPNVPAPPLPPDDEPPGKVEISVSPQPTAVESATPEFHPTIATDDDDFFV